MRELGSRKTRKRGGIRGDDTSEQLLSRRNNKEQTQPSIGTYGVRGGKALGKKRGEKGVEWLEAKNGEEKNTG